MAAFPPGEIPRKLSQACDFRRPAPGAETGRKHSRLAPCELPRNLPQSPVSPVKKPTPKARDKRPLCIGLLGGVASGKSTVARALERLGATVLDADRLAHEVLEEPQVAAAVRAKFGPGVEAADGSLDRKKIASRVFADETLRKWLEAQIHPRVRERIREGIDAARAAGKSLVVLDVPLLAEGGLIALCDTTLFVAAPAEQREARARRERGWQPGETARRESRQAALEDKRRLAQHEIENSGSIEELETKVRVWLDNLLKKS